MAEAASNSATDGQSLMALGGVVKKGFAQAMGNISIQKDFGQMMDLAQDMGMMDGSQAKGISDILFDNDKSNDSVGIFNLLNQFQIPSQIQGVSIN